MSRPMSRLRAVVQMLGTLTVLGGLLAGVPLALVKWGHWPITGTPGWDDVRDLPSAIVSDEAILALLALALWASWALFVGSVLAEAVAQFQGRTRAPLRLGGPLQRLAGHLIGSLVVCVGSLGSGASASLIMPSAAMAQPALPTAGHAAVTVQVDDAGAPGGTGFRFAGPSVTRDGVARSWSGPGVVRHGDDGGRGGPGLAPGARGDLGDARALLGAEAAPPVSTPRQAAPTVAVQRGDSPWSLAETYLGDGMRWREIWELNQSRQQADGTVWSAPEAAIRPGWELELPADAGGADASAPAAPAATAAAPAATPAAPAALAATPPAPAPAPAPVATPAAPVTVQPGDHFWKLAEDQLTAAWGRAPSDAEITPHWQALVEANRHLLAPPHDPDLVYPGQVFTLLPAPADPTRPAPPAAPEPEPAPAEESGTGPADDAGNSDETTDSGDPSASDESTESGDGDSDQTSDTGEGGSDDAGTTGPASADPSPSDPGAGEGDPTDTTPTTPTSEAPPSEGGGDQGEEEPPATGAEPPPDVSPDQGGQTDESSDQSGAEPPPDVSPDQGQADEGQTEEGQADESQEGESQEGDDTQAGAAVPGSGTGNEGEPPPPGRGDSPPPGSGDRAPTATAAEGTNRGDADDGSTMPVGLIGGGLAVAGVVVLLERRRRAQQRHRGRGRRTALPQDGLQDDERLLRGGADVDGARVLDLALRAAAAGAQATGLPPLRWVEASADEVLLVLAAPAPPPRGFTAVAPDRWLISGSAEELAAVAGHAEMPAPTLIPVGTTSDDRELLIELEASGVVTVVGPSEATIGLLRAIAVATATAPWSEQSRVLLVGLHGQLTDLPWVTPIPRLAEAIEAAETHVDRTTTALWSLRCQSTAQARAAGITPDAWESLVVVTAVAPNELGERQRVAALAEQPRKAVALVTPQTGGQDPLGRVLTIGPDGWVRIDGVDVAVWPHRLEEADAGIVMALLDLAAQHQDVAPSEAPATEVRLPPPPRTEDVPPVPDAAGWGRAEASDVAAGIPVDLVGDDRLPDDDRRLVLADQGRPDPPGDEPGAEVRADDDMGPAAPADERDRQAAAGPGVEPVGMAPEPPLEPVRRLDALLDEIDVVVRVLGEVEAIRRDPGTGAEERLVPVRQKALEAITYLALRESTVDREDLEANLFPDGANAAKTVYNTVSAARALVGEELFPPIEGGRYSLSERVVTDYGLFCELVAQADETDDALLAADLLTDALSLVRGEPFTGVGRSYAWVGPHRGMIVAQVVDAAEELAEVRLAMNDWRSAEWATRRGLRAFPSDERMYRLLMRAARAAGNVPGVQRVFRELCDVIADPDLGVEPEDTLHPETVALLEELTGATPRHGQKGA